MTASPLFANIRVLTINPWQSFRFFLVVILSFACETATPQPGSNPGVRGASADEAPDLDAFLATIPEVDVPSRNAETMLGLAAMPLACIDRPHSGPANRPAYLDDRTVVRRPDYETTRSFYGCYDWHSAVNSTWAMVRILKEFPDLSVANLLREKLQHHLAEKALAGELEFFEESKTFERPYGWAWLMQLHTELLSWDDPDAREWAPRIAPLTSLFAERTIEYVKTISYPSRVGTHGNTAFSVTMMLDFARATQHTDLERALVDKALEFYRDDVDCPTAYEPSASDFLSPCLEEAKLMSRILEVGDYADWLDRFLPPVASEAFRPLTVAVEVRGDEEQLEETNLLGAKSHLIGLALIRAEALNSIAAALPAGDPRVAAYRKLAAFHGRTGFDAMFDADYMGTHWIGTFALRYLLTSAP